MMRRRPILPVLVLGFGLVACESEAARRLPESVAPVDRAVAKDPAMERTSECINRTEGYAVEYPAGWHVDRGAVLGPCSLFDPDPVDVPPASELPLEIAIQIGFEPIPFATLTGAVLGRRDLERKRRILDAMMATFDFREPG